MKSRSRCESGTGDEGGEAPLKVVSSAGPARRACRDARVVLRLKEPNLDQRVEAMMGKVSRPHPLSKVRNPRFPRGCARLAWRLGRQRRADCFDTAATGGNISVGPYSSTAVPLMWSPRMPPRSQLSRGFCKLNVRWLFEFGSGSSKAERGALIVPLQRQT
jgi:hypothetical protein